MSGDPDAIVRRPDVPATPEREITRLHLALALLCTSAMQKKIYKVLTPIQKHNSQGAWFMRVGSGYTNKDDSINIYLDAMPVNGKLQIRDRPIKGEIRASDSFGGGR